MCARQFTLLKAAFDAAFPLDSIVMYEQDGVPEVGFITGMNRERYIVVNTLGKELELTKVRLHRVPLGFPADLKTTDEKVAFLRSIRSKAKEPISLEPLWTQCLAEGEKIFTDAELIERLMGSSALEAYVPGRVLILKDRVFFKRDKDGFVARQPHVVEELKAAERNRAARRKLFEETAAFVKQRAKDRSLEIPAEIKEGLDILALCAANRNADDNEALTRDAEELVVLAETAMHLEPQGRLDQRAFHILYKAGIFKKDTNLSLIKHNPPIEFSPEELAQAESMIVPQSLDQYLDAAIRINLAELEAITIDDESTKDMDDALSLVETDSGFKLYVHISDVATLLPQRTPLDDAARRRATSIYCPEITIPMLPESLSADKLSLKAGEVRPAITCLFELDRNYGITHGTLMASLVKVTKRLSYNDVDKLLESGDPFLTNLHSIAATHEAKRLAQGATPVQKRDAQAVLGEKGEISVMEVDEQSPARALIGEMMVLANMVMANFLHAHGVPALYRSQEAPDSADLGTISAIPAGPARDYAERGRLKRSVVSPQPGFHATLGVHAYVQCSSPIRRFLDLVTQRQILAELRGEPAPYSLEALQEIQNQIEEPLARAVLVSRETKRYWLLRYLEKKYMNTKRIKGVVVRTDTKMPMVELDEVFIIAGARIRNPVLGNTYELTVQLVDARSDYIRLEEYKPRHR